ncbi:MAG: hypothetical protein ACLP4V_08220 [Methylocella sp.]
MTAVIPLGTFKQVPVREAWPREDENFTPWLAQAEIIPLLGEALNLRLEVEAVEHWVARSAPISLHVPSTKQTIA